MQPHLINGSFGHTSLPSKRHLDWLSRFSEHAHGCDQHTDTRNVDLRRSCLCYACDMRRGWPEIARNVTGSSAIAEGPRDASCQLKSCQLARNSAETTYTTSHDQIDGMKLEI